MSLCEQCRTRSDRPCGYEATTREYFRVLIAPLRFVAERCGYALAVHGSLKTDIDLVAVPWRVGAVSQAALAEQIRVTAEQIIGIAEDHRRLPTQKDHGRLAWAFHLVPLGDRGPYIDLSIIPPVVDPNPKEVSPVGKMPPALKKYQFKKGGGRVGTAKKKATKRSK